MDPDKRDGSAPLWPPELPFILLIVPLPAAYLLGHNLLERSLPLLLRGVFKMHLPFIAFGGLFQVLYSLVLPDLLRDVLAPLQRAVIHAATMLCAVPARLVAAVSGARGTQGRTRSPAAGLASAH